MSDSVSKPSITSLIHDYYAQKPNFTQHIGKPSTDADAPSEDLEALHLRSNPKDFPSPEEIRRAFLRKGGYLRKKPANMPVHPAEEHASGNITDQVAKDSKDSTASSHPLHQEDTGASSGGSIGAMAHKANPGPVMPENMPEKASKEELKKRAEELNK
ncbi:hypothetical protein BU26DRAFT_599663 [Trematosphaeria pertusa]|uniref:Uncharacterized protein n=1 Tax=Trematosphaeria pertusa TaxID=390896 RepID=A0A6A6J414_9PLEO|nr:uncharacterized protein BU26DRAFT_599663 [Trematosphaeria pertusa]KAF2257097.1 hypothetical protein BU26DRAFT_599663 [Trematosphaeria pertusa]